MKTLRPLIVISVLVLTGCRSGPSEIDQALGSTGHHWLLASGVEHGQPWAFYAARGHGGQPVIGFSNNIFQGGGVGFGGFEVTSGVDRSALDGIVHGTDGVNEAFDAIVGFAPMRTRTVLAHGANGVITDAAALRIAGFNVRFFVLTGPSITTDSSEVMGFTAGGKALGTTRTVKS